MPILGEARELEGIGQERQYDVATIDLHSGVRSVRPGIPTVVQLSELRRHASPMSEMPYWL